jgi:hypothetical protein
MANSPPKPLQNRPSRRPAKTASPGILFLVGLLFFLPFPVDPSTVVSLCVPNAAQRTIDGGRKTVECRLNRFCLAKNG